MKQYTEIELTQEQKEFFAGCMLGDGNMKKPKSENSNSMFCCQHGTKQAEYNKYKCNLLKSIGAKYYEYTRKTPNKKTGLFYSYNIVSTNFNKTITKLYNMLYKNGKKRITNEILEHFSAFSLAILFMDDGTKTKPETCSNEQTTYVIASCGFNIDSLKLFQNFLWKKFHIETTITKDNRIYIRMNSRNLFESLIIPYVKQVPCMLYKLRNEAVS